MQEPSIRTSRIAIAGGLAAILAIGGSGFFLGRLTAPRPVPAAPVVVAPAAAQPAMTTPKPLNRADLILLAQQTADARASTTPTAEAVTDAAGRRFDLLLPFGCSGPSDQSSAQPLQWRYDPKTEALRVSVMPSAWTGSDWELDGPQTQRAEGFWIARPWTSSERCPSSAAPPPVGAEPVTLPGQTLAIAQFSGEATAILSRDGKPFEIVKRVPAAAFDGRQGLGLRIKGRLDRTGDPIRCVQPAGVDQRPICVITARIDELRIENMTTGDALATWPIS
jgi:hypothetical protein